MCPSLSRCCWLGDTVELSSIQLYLDNNLIHPQRCVKYLGVLVDSDLVWTEHIQSVRKKCLAVLSVLSKKMKIEKNVLSKKMKIELSGEVSKNQVFCTSLRKMIKLDELVIDTGLVDETPPVYSPFRRSTTDLYMYHEQYYKQGIANVACIASNTEDIDDAYGNDEEDSNTGGDDDDDDERLRITCSGVWEMKNNGKATKQLYAYMMHTGYQLTVKALKEGEVIDVMVVYGLSVNYEKKVGWLFRLTTNFTIPQRRMEDFGKFPLVDAVNIVIEKVTGNQDKDQDKTV